MFQLIQTMKCSWNIKHEDGIWKQGHLDLDESKLSASPDPVFDLMYLLCQVFVLFHFHICAALPINLNCGNIILMFRLKDDPRCKDIAF